MPAGYIGPSARKIRGPKDDNRFWKRSKRDACSRIKPSNFPFCNLPSGPARLLYNPR